MSPNPLRQYSRKQLEVLARQQGVPRIRQLRKSDLIEAIQAPPADPHLAFEQPRLPVRPPASRLPSERAVAPASAAASSRQPRGVLQQLRAAAAGSSAPDRLEIASIDGHWIRTTWQLTLATLERAAIALGPDRHAARFVLQLSGVAAAAHSALQLLSEQEIPADAQVWYLPALDHCDAYQLALAVRGSSGRVHTLCRSRLLSAPSQQSRSPSEPTFEAPVSGSTMSAVAQDFSLEPADAEVPALHVGMELIIRGDCDASSRITVNGQPVSVDPSGGFIVRQRLGSGRHVIPIVATARSAGSERTMLVGMDVSTRELEPRSRRSS